MSETTEPTSSSTPADGGLARQLLQLRQESAELKRRLNAVTVAQETVGELAEQVEVLADRVKALEEQAAGDDDSGKLKVWDWSRLMYEDGPESKAARAELSTWVKTVLDGLYGLVRHRRPQGNDQPGAWTIPRCWHQHPDLVAELGWLCQEWTRIYRTSKGTPAQAGDWHDRYLHGLRRRLPTTTAAGCADKHRDPEPEPEPRRY